MSHSTDVPCPSCGAPAGERCRTSNGAPYTGHLCAHVARLAGREIASTSRQLAGRLGGLKSWANTPDRTARTSNGRAAGPGSIGYWLARLDPVRFADASDEQKVAAATAAKKAHYARLALKSAQVRARKSRRA